MRITEARLVVRAARKADFPRAGLPEFAFVGRSNVGKSSLLNALVGHRGLARISSSPGCTRGIHFYVLNRRILFVDLPGYGYSKVSRALRAAWRPLVQSYLVRREPLRLVWHLVDARHPPTGQDVQLVEWLQGEGIPFRVALTKTDKLSRGEGAQSARRCREILELPAENEPPVLTSARRRTGVATLWTEMERRIRKGPSGEREGAEARARGASRTGG